MKPKFTYYLTTRGPNARGRILSLDCLPPSFHRYITIVSGAEHEKHLTKTYPDVSYWANPSHIKSASSKREFIFQSSKVDNFFFVNDETRIYTAIGGGKARSPLSAPEKFIENVIRMEDLAKTYVGVAAHQKLFSGGLISTHSMLKENSNLGTWFHWNRKFALSKLTLNRFNYLDDVDYVIQALNLGYKTASFGGILYEHRTTVPQRQHRDRTVSIQELDTERLLKTHPNCMSLKPDYDPLTQDIGVKFNLKVSYNPVGSVLVVGDQRTSPDALAFYLSSMRLKRTHNLKIAMVGDNESLTSSDSRDLVLDHLGVRSPGTDSVKATVRMFNSADTVVVFSKKVKRILHEEFPRSDLSKIQVADSPLTTDDLREYVKTAITWPRKPDWAPIKTRTTKARL